ncbi:MAG: hypothetical protein M1836_007160 [Candelina mexicana]|nr:MAG: hypothetical protein M1836_007160 [Candelina mexicana]
MSNDSLKELGTPEYWNKRYDDTSKDGEKASHEWFRTFAQLRSFFEKELPAAETHPRILHLGCGDSVRKKTLGRKDEMGKEMKLITLTADLFNLHYTNQLSVDFSDVVITQMKAQHPHLEWRVEDVRKLELEDSSFDIAIDKGTLDAMLYGSPWDPPDEVRNRIRQYVNEVWRILKPKGKWLYVTYRQPHFMKPLLLSGGRWELVVEDLQDGPGSLEYFTFAMTKDCTE